MRNMQGWAIDYRARDAHDSSMRLVIAVTPDKLRVHEVLQVDRCLLLLLMQLFSIPDFLNGHLRVHLSHTSTPPFKSSTPQISIRGAFAMRMLTQALGV